MEQLTDKTKEQGCLFYILVMAVFFGVPCYALYKFIEGIDSWL